MIKFDLKKQLRKNRMTMTELHEITGISKNTLSLLSRGESQGIQFKTLEKICRVLECEPNDLIKIRFDKYSFSVSMNPYYNKNGYKSYNVDFYPKKVEEDLFFSGYFVDSSDFHALFLGFSVEEISEDNKRLLVNFGLPWLELDEEFDRYKNEDSIHYNSLSKTSLLLSSFELPELFELTQNVVSFITGRLLDSDTELTEAIVSLKLDMLKTTVTPTFSYKLKEDENNKVYDMED